MKTDLYTKTVLTVIAVFLGVLIFQNTSVISTVQANTAATTPTPLPTATQASPVDVNITHIGGIELNISTPFEYEGRKYITAREGLPVYIKYNNDK
uniref:hypothetical protein n=1 Tax=uncultured Dysgonomonas sp. TaxID=206096 RepID=UPI002629BBBE|nr:hypothetical protein [uncultured Dysgonomonas sp.]